MWLALKRRAPLPWGVPHCGIGAPGKEGPVFTMYLDLDSGRDGVAGQAEADGSGRIPILRRIRAIMAGREETPRWG